MASCRLSSTIGTGRQRPLHSEFRSGAAVSLRGKRAPLPMMHRNSGASLAAATSSPQAARQQERASRTAPGSARGWGSRRPTQALGAHHSHVAAAAAATSAEALTLEPISTISGTVKLPGSKSLSNRILLLAALAEVCAHATLRGPSLSTSPCCRIILLQQGQRGTVTGACDSAPLCPG